MCTNTKSIEDEIKTQFVTKKHFQALSDAVINRPGKANFDKLNIIVSFRQAGEDAVRMLNAGAGAKPHAILDKSIKPDRLKEKFSESEISGISNINRIFGLVAFSVENKANLDIGGLYLTTEGKNYFNDNQNENYLIKKNTDNNREYLSVERDLYNFIESITTDASTGKVKPETEYAKWFITGDYDVHDLVCLTGQRHPVPSDSWEEAEFMTKLNDAMTGNHKWADKEAERKTCGSGIKKFEPGEYDPIQHGPQYNYITYTYNNEPKKGLVEKVARIDVPVAILDKNGWSIIKEASELVKYYEKNSIKVKDLWKLTPEGENYLKARVNKSFEEYMREITGRSH